MDMNDKLSTEKDLEQYKLLNVKEDPLDCRQKHLDALDVTINAASTQAEKHAQVHRSGKKTRIGPLSLNVPDLVPESSVLPRHYKNVLVF